MHFVMKNPEPLMRPNRLIQSTYAAEDPAGVRTRTAAALAAAFPAQRAAVTHLPASEPAVRLARLTFPTEDADPRGITMDEVREAAAGTARLLSGTVADDGTRFLAPDRKAVLLQVITGLLARCSGTHVRVPASETTARSAWSI